MSSRPETILQFGTGRFLRAFANYFVHRAQVEGQDLGSVVIVQSMGNDTAKIINEQLGKYSVLVRGMENGQVVDRAEEIHSVSRALAASSQWDFIREIVRTPELQIILSNTTEAGYVLEPTDTCMSYPPKSFPGKLLLLLKDRYDSGLPGLTIIPCELMEGNARLLRECLEGLCDLWGLDHKLKHWLGEECVWLNTLVDRIVTGPPEAHPLLEKDRLLITAEPFAFWAMETHPKAARFVQHQAIVRATDITPYFLRKVRILNGAHTALLIKARKKGFTIVRKAVEDPQLLDWLQRLLFEEIVPTLDGRVDQPVEFAKQTIERFRNPFLEHRFADIAMNHESKMKIRLLPTRDEFQSRFGKVPPLLNEVIEEGLADLKKVV